MKTYNAFKLTALACLVFATSLGIELSTTGLWAAPIPANKQFTNRPQFRIPFHYDSDELARMGARQIRLYISRDRGRTWEEGDSVLPNAGKFAYKATAEGEYWFLVRTVDAKNKLYPDMSVTEPGLKVVVDTTPPQLELRLHSPSPGNVQLSWNATDENLDPSQLRVEYMQPGALEWQDVSIVPKASDKIVWKIPRGGRVSVRATIGDLAKNATTETAETRVLPANQIVPRPGAPESRQPVAGPGNDVHDDLALRMPDRFPGAGLGPQDDGDREDVASADRFSSPLRHPTAALLPSSTVKGNFVSHKPDERLASTAESASAPVSRTVNGPRAGTAGRRRFVDSRKFQIGYNLEGVGPSGVSSVDVYITEDDGRTWFHYGTDDDHVSPIVVEVPSEGTYGFTLGVRSGTGLSSDPPQNGDLPQVVVVVDQTSPQLEMLPVQQGTGRNIGKMNISWKCEDANLADKPISLFYSTSGQAPWTAISGPIDNSGSYVWTVGGGVPPKVVIRIEARDLAGHVQTVDSPQSLAVDLSRPTAKIIDIESPDGGTVPR